MQLIYKLGFNSTNGYFKDIINEIIDECSVNAQCEQYKDFLTITIDENEEKIHQFFTYLEQNLPLSIFLSKGEVIQSVDSSLEPIDGTKNEQNIAIKASKIMDIYQSSNAYESEAKAIKNGEIISLETSNGTKNISIATPDNRKQLGSNVNVMVVNLNVLKELLALSPKDVQLLSAIERPLVKLKFNILKNKDKEYSDTNFVYAKLPCDEQEYELATALRKEGVNFLIYSEQAIQEELKVTYSDDKNIIISGDKALFPRYDYVLQKEFKTANDYFNETGGVFKSVLSQFNKRVQPSMGVYMSMKSYESAISVNIPAKGVTDIIKIPNVFTNYQNCIEDIENIDENTPRLVENYKKRFPEVFEREPTLNNTHGFETILNLIAHLIGLKDAKAFEDKAYEFNAKSGINVDFKVVKIDGMNYLDYRRIVQSMMSYKMADVDNTLLAFSFYESLSEFITDNINAIKSEIKSFDVVLCGDMFANATFLSKTTKALKQYNILIPTQYPLDISK